MTETRTRTVETTVTERRCDACQSWYAPRGGRSRWCSSACRQRAYRARLVANSERREMPTMGKGE